jgi:hypothetical protein
MGRDDRIAVRRPASFCVDRNALDLSQRETGVPRDADIVVDTHVRRRSTHRVPRSDGWHRSHAYSIRRVKMWTGTVKTLLLAACLLSVGANALAQTSPEPIMRNGVAYITGGIGEDEVTAFRDVAPRYNLRITFASKSGHYLADVDVTLSAGKSTILDAHTSGPFLFARVPPGRYTVSAHDRAIQEVRHVVVPARGAIDVRFYWHDPERHGTMHLCAACPASQQQPAR